MSKFLFVILFALSALPLAAQPSIGGILNNYSYALPGTTSYGIAQGSIFALFGVRMGPTDRVAQGFDPALERTLAGVSIKATVAGVTTDAIPYYVSAGQIGAILPSNTPVGDGTITVTYNGQTSPPFPIKVVASAFGILTLSGAGNGTAAVYDANFQYVTLTAAANSGQTVIFWGAGLGAFAADETRLITPANMENVPVEFYIGGQRAVVTYRGRSAFPGLDQINVVIPAGVFGCFVSAYVKIGAFVSNFVTIPIAQTGRVCSDPHLMSAEQVQQTLSGQTVNAGWLSLGRFTIHVPGINAGPIVLPATTTISDGANAGFLRYTPFNFSNYGGQGVASIGSCIVSAFMSNNVFVPPIVQALDAGGVALRTPDGSTKTLVKVQNSWVFSASSANPGDVLFIPDSGGTYRFIGSGGPDVGPFDVPVTLSSGLVWTNRASITEVNRSNSLEVTWSGGQPNTYVWITGSSTDGNNPALLTSFTCTAPVAAQRFTIPQPVLGSLVPSFQNPALPIPIGQLSVGNYSNPTSFTATGLNSGMVTFYNATYTTLNYR